MLPNVAEYLANMNKIEMYAKRYYNTDSFILNYKNNSVIIKGKGIPFQNLIDTFCTALDYIVVGRMLGNRAYLKYGAHKIDYIGNGIRIVSPRSSTVLDLTQVARLLDEDMNGYLGYLDFQGVTPIVNSIAPSLTVCRGGNVDNIVVFDKVSISYGRGILAVHDMSYVVNGKGLVKSSNGVLLTINDNAKNIIKGNSVVESWGVWDISNGVVSLKYDEKKLPMIDLTGIASDNVNFELSTKQCKRLFESMYVPSLKAGYTDTESKVITNHELIKSLLMGSKSPTVYSQLFGKFNLRFASKKSNKVEAANKLVYDAWKI